MNYEETVKEIEDTFGIIPGFMKDAPQDILIQMWPLFKKYQVGESIIPQKYREMMMLAAAAATKAPATSPADAAKVPNVPAPAGGAKTPEAPPKAAAKVEDPPPPLSVPAGYRYEPRGRRDPFVNPVPKTQGGGLAEDPIPVVRPDGLPGVLVSEVKLSGIVHSTDNEMNKAMLVVGRNTYFAKKGDRLFDGVVKEIRRNEVVFGMVSASTRKPVNRDTVVRTGASSGTSAGEMK